MKQAWTDLKSFITIVMTLVMAYILIFGVKVEQAPFALYSTAYGSVITFFFTKKGETKTDTTKEDVDV